MHCVLDLHPASAESHCRRIGAAALVPPTVSALRQHGRAAGVIPSGSLATSVMALLSKWCCGISEPGRVILLEPADACFEAVRCGAVDALARALWAHLPNWNTGFVVHFYHSFTDIVVEVVRCWDEPRRDRRGHTQASFRVQLD